MANALASVPENRDPQSVTGIAVTAVFCFITAWNEYAFALMMTNRNAQTAPPFIPAQLGSGLTDWTVIAAGSLLFLLPVALFTFFCANACRWRHFLRYLEATAWGSKPMRDQYRKLIGKYIVPLAMSLMILEFFFLCQPWSEFFMLTV